jgi:ATP-dependent exoDNAse (exonuclease V) beta subunit
MPDFTAEQKECIFFFPKKPQHLLIEAGAGAGKTAVLAKRVKWLLQNQDPAKRINPAELFLITFSKDAAREISDRVAKEFQQPVDQLTCSSEFLSFIHISTIDSFFAELVDCLYPRWWEHQKKDTDLFTMSPRLQLVEEHCVSLELEYEIQKLLQEHTWRECDLLAIIDFMLSGGFQRGHGRFLGTFETLLKMLCSDVFLSSQEHFLRIVSQKVHPAANILIKALHRLARKHYHKRLLKGQMTYADRTVFLKENLHEDIPIHVAELIVDEYQDTNHLQHEILFHIVNRCQGRMVVVGDPKQSIYGFRNASVDVFQNLKKSSYSKLWKHIELKKNFRSKPALLEEMNTLSSFAFSWENPKIPIEFKTSFFEKEALKKYTPQNSLEPDIKKDDAFKNSGECVQIVTHSLFEARNLDKESSLHQKKLENYTLQTIPLFIQKMKKERHAEWQNFAILCEENKDILKIKNLLIQENIPVFCEVSDPLQNETNLPLQVALSLTKCLANEDTNYDLYKIMQSPICFITHQEIEEYFFKLKSKIPFQNQITEKISFYKKFAQKNFFKAWQMLRWELVFLHTDKKSKQNAFIFCAHMDFFASVLWKKVNSYTLEKDLESYIEQNEKTGPFLSKDFSPWNIQNSSHDNQAEKNAVDVRTVHKAKGLQWKHVFFFPKFGGAKPLGNFIFATSEKYFDMTWLQDDSENMCVMKRVKNEDFFEKDSFIKYKKNGEIGEIFWFANLRKKREQDFERQRVFYTAFTRAEETLTLFQPKRYGTQKKGLRDELENLGGKMSFGPQNYLEEDLYLKYLDHHFSLRTNTPLSKKTAHVPREPWFQEGEDFPKAFISKNKNVFYYDFGPKFANRILFQKNTQKQIVPEQTNTFYEFQNEDQIFKEDHPEILQKSNPFCERKLQNFISKINKIRKLREHSAKGVLYHAAAENQNSQKSFLQKMIEKKSELVFREFEIWRQGNTPFTTSKRMILDLLSFMKKDDFCDLHFHKIFNFSIQKEKDKKDILHTLSQYEKVALVLDFKTGKKDFSHVEQIQKYMEITAELVKSDFWFSKERSVVIGALCYTQSLSPYEPWHEVGKILPFEQIDSQESVCFFM